MEDVALLFHLLGAFLIVGGTIVAGGRVRGGTPEGGAVRDRAPARRIGVLLVALGTLLVLGFGLWLVHLGTFGYGVRWIDATLGLLLAAVILGAFGGQRPKQVRRLAIRQTNSAQASPELRALLDDRTARALNYVSVLLLLVIVALMVFKPARHTLNIVGRGTAQPRVAASRLGRPSLVGEP